MNNRVYFIKLKDGKQYVVRIYNQGGDVVRVLFEHEILTKLSAKFESKKVFFEVPTLIKPINEGKTYVALSSGTFACVFKVIPGKIADSNSVKTAYSCGEATG